MIDNKENIILDIFLKSTDSLHPYGYEDDFVQLMISKDVLPPDIKQDRHGNYFYKIGESRTVFTSHMDTVCKDRVAVNHIFNGDMIKTDGKTILGADDRAGITIMSYMIKNHIPGLYYFFVGEEVGCIGSKASAMFDEKLFKGVYDRMISFDRRGVGSVITYQSFSRCCSNEFADSLADQLNKFGLKYGKDENGVYTDSAEFVKVIPECTNLSVGYYNEHTFNESLNINHLEKLANACLLVDWEILPVKRDMTKDDDFCYGNFSRSRSFGNFDVWTETSYDEDDFYEDYSYRKKFNTYKEYLNFDKKYGREYYEEFEGIIPITRSKRGKKEDKLSKNNLRKELLNSNFSKTDDRYCYKPLLDLVIEDNLTKDDMLIIRDQYLDMTDEGDRDFYCYLIGNVID